MNMDFQNKKKNKKTLLSKPEAAKGIFTYKHWTSSTRKNKIANN